MQQNCLSVQDGSDRHCYEGREAYVWLVSRYLEEEFYSIL